MKIDVLDQGYVRLIETWGTGEGGLEERHEDNTIAYLADYEAGIIEAARQSTQGAFRGWGLDAKLLAHLWNEEPKHSGPFEFAGMILEVQAPIFVFREWHRHRTQSYAEMSARYEALPEGYYQPELMNVLERGNAVTSNKQAQGKGKLTEEHARAWNRMAGNSIDVAENAYQFGLRVGVPKEVARIVMPVGHYTRMRAGANLWNWFKWLGLRDHPKAQWEIRQYAEVVGKIVAETFPHTWALFEAERRRVCSSGHERIRYYGDKCPLCEVLKGER